MGAAGNVPFPITQSEDTDTLLHLLIHVCGIILSVLGKTHLRPRGQVARHDRAASHAGPGLPGRWPSSRWARLRPSPAPRPQQDPKARWGGAGGETWLQGAREGWHGPPTSLTRPEQQQVLQGGCLGS